MTNTDTVRIRLIFSPLPATQHEGKPTLFGLQDKAQNVQAGTSKGKRSSFETTLSVSKLDTSAPVLSGPFAHGSPAERFLYLSWKRRVGTPPWIERVKVPLAGITTQQLLKASQSAGVIEADVSGRRPHQTTPIVWKIVRS